MEDDSKYSSNDEYFDTETGCFRILLGITSPQLLKEAELKFVSMAIADMAQNPVVDVEVNAGLKSLCRIHFKMFSEIYDWAGKIRKLDISKGTTRFANVNHIVSYPFQIEHSLRKENFLRNLDHDIFSERLAHYWGEWNEVHPFRDGNGRATREWCSQLSLIAGHKIAWDAIDQQVITDASIRSMRGDNSGLQEIVQQSLRCH